MPIDHACAKTVAGIYQRHGCWTWTRNWTWADEECFLPDPFRTAPAGEPSPDERLRFVVSEF